MKLENVIFKSKKFLTLLVALWITNGACYEQVSHNDDIAPILLISAILNEYNCSLPNAIDIGAKEVPPTRRCISEKSPNGLIYNNTNGLAITTSSVANGTQLECRGLGGALVLGNNWYKSAVTPISSGYAPIFIHYQMVNKDGSGNVISYQPFANYASGDLMICVPLTSERAETNYYQVIKIL